MKSIEELRSPVPNEPNLIDTLNRGVPGLFEDSCEQPSPHMISYLINSGFNRDIILQIAKYHGVAEPTMSDTLRDLDTSLPFVHMISDTIAKHHRGKKVMFAGRDAVGMYLDFAIAHSDEDSVLLPASMDLWASISDSDPAMVADFLESHGVAPTKKHRKHPDYLLVDTGFMGTVGLRLDEQISAIYGTKSLRRTGKLEMKLVSAHAGAYGTQVIDFDTTASAGTIDTLKRPSRAYAEELSSAEKLAINMQLDPKYHPPYSYLEEVGGRVVAVPRPIDRTPELDYQRSNVDNSLRHFSRDELVNPVAALLHQLRVVSSAMSREIGPAGPQITISSAVRKRKETKPSSFDVY